MSRDKTTQEWQPISNYPNNRANRIFANKEGEVMCGYFENNNFYYYSDHLHHYLFKPTHFMELPKPPKQ